MDLSTGCGLFAGVRQLLSAGPIPPTAIGLLPDLTLETGVAMSPRDLSSDFTGAGLSYALAPGSDALPSGLSLSATGVLSGTPTAEVGPLTIVIRATNTLGFAESAFSLTVADMLLTFDAVLTGLTNNPTFGPSAESGVTLTAVASNFSGPTPGSFTYQWATVQSGPIAGATSASYTPTAALFDAEQLFCTITPVGYPALDTAPAVIRHAPPTGGGNPGEQFWDIDTGVQTIDMSPFASGAQLNWTVAAQGASINAATGLLSIRTESQAIGAVATVTASNSGGAISVVFSFHVEDPEAGPGPDLSIPILDDGTNTIGLTVDADCTIYWRRDATGTNPDPGDVIAGGGFDGGSFFVSSGANSTVVTFAGGNDGLQEISFVAAVELDEPSLVRTAAIDIDTVAPALTSSVPAAGATAVAIDIEPVLTFSEAVTAGAGVISLYDVTNSATVESFNVQTNTGTGVGQVAIAGTTVTLRPASQLVGDRDYAILIDPGALSDIAGNPHGGIAGTGTLGFSTGTGGAVIDTEFGAAFPTAHASVWTSMQTNPYNATPEHAPGETWPAFAASLSDGGVRAVKDGNYPQLRFAVPVVAGRTYTIDADFPLGETNWTGPLRVKIGSAIDQSDYAQIDESEAGQPKVVEVRGQQVTATSSELWFAVICETGSGGANGGNPAIAMLRVEEV